MKGKLLFRYQGLQGGFIVQMILWRLPVVIAERPHGLKYRLYCGRGSECIVRYDNETGKGDHRHYGNYEEPYDFESLDKLISDFKLDCSRLAGWKWI
jgi:hypothetical protein